MCACRALDLLSGRTVAIKQIDLKASRKQDIEDMMVNYLRVLFITKLSEFL